MPNPSHLELSRPAPLARRRWTLAVSTTLGLCALVASVPAHAEPQSAPAAPAAPPGDPAAMGAPPAAPPGATPPPGYGAPPPGYGAPPAGSGYGAPPPGYGYPYPYYGYYGGAPPPPPPRFERNSTGMMVGGILLTSAGIVAILTGSALASTAGNQIDVYCESPGGGGPFVCERRADETQLAAGYGVLIGGIVALGAGIPLWLIGGKRVPAKDEAAPIAQPPSASMRLLVGPSSATLDVRF